MGLTGFGAVIVFTPLASVLSFFIISGSSMWTILGAVFVPGLRCWGSSQPSPRRHFATQILIPLNPCVVLTGAPAS